MHTESGSRLSARYGAAAVNVRILPDLDTAETCVLKQCRQHAWKTFPCYSAHDCDLDSVADSLEISVGCSMLSSNNCYVGVSAAFDQAQPAQHQAADTAAAKVVPASELSRFGLQLRSKLV